MRHQHKPGEPENTDAPPTDPAKESAPEPVLEKEVSPFWIFFLQAPFAFCLHFVIFVFTCVSISNGNVRSSTTQLILGASLYCLLSLAIAVALYRLPSKRGYAMGMFIGVAITGWMTGTCALSGHP